MAMILTESGFVTQSQKESIQSNKYKYDIDLDLAVDSKKQYSKLVDKFKRQNDDIQIDVDFDAIYNGLNLRTNNFETLCKALRDLYVGGDFSGTDGLAFMIFGNDFSYVTPEEKAIIKKYDPEGYEMDFGEDVESKSIKEDAFDYDENSEKDQLIWDHLSMKFADICKEILGIDSEVVPEQEWITLINILVRINKMTNSGEYAESSTQNTFKDIDTLLDIAGGKDEVEQRIIDALRNYPNADAEELAEILEDDNLSYDDWTSIVEYLDIDF